MAEAMTRLDGGAERAELEAHVASLLEEARRGGATAAEAGAGSATGLEVSVRHGEVETLEQQRDRGLWVTVYRGRRKGSASTTDLSPAAIHETVAAACSRARHTAEDPYAGLADPALMARETPDLDLYHPWSLSGDDAVALARTCEAAALGLDRRIDNSEGASVSTHQGLRVYGNSHGFVGGYATTRHAIACRVLAREGDAMQRDYWYTTARHASDLADAEAVGRRAAERTVRRLGARPIRTGRYPVLFAPEMARSLLGHFVGAISGGALYRQASFLLDSLGQAVFPEFVRIRERPHLPRALGSAPFDGEGVATRERDLVRDGVVQGYVLNSYAARRLGMETTGNAGGVHNLEIDPGPGSEDFEALLRRMGRGLVVTELMGQGVNTVTGDYSRGAAGFWVEDGAIVHPVEGITVAGNLKTAFAALVATGADVRTDSNLRTGSWLMDALTVAAE